MQALLAWRVTTVMRVTFFAIIRLRAAGVSTWEAQRILEAMAFSLASAAVGGSLADRLGCAIQEITLCLQKALR